jgi:hypothetical protein
MVAQRGTIRVSGLVEERRGRGSRERLCGRQIQLNRRADALERLLALAQREAPAENPLRLTAFFRDWRGRCHACAS